MQKPNRLLVLSVLAIAMVAMQSLPAIAADQPSGSKPLPRVLLIGDSICGGYHKQVIQQLDGKAYVQKNPGNAEYTGTGLKKIDEWLGDGKWDVIHFNWGLWDMYGWQYRNEDRSPAMYAKRLEALVTRLEQTGAKLIWATTTPACPGPEVTMLKRWKTEVVITPELEQQYQAAALGVMKKHNVQVNDLYALMKPELSKYATAPDNVHFTGAGYGKLAGQIVDALTKAIADLNKTQTTGAAGQTHQAPRSFASMQQGLTPSKIISYKTVGQRELALHIFYPEDFKPTDRRPAYVVIHGGGWRSGTPRRFYPYAASLLSQGFVGISVEYRLISGQSGTTVFDCVKDGRAAIRYIRSHAMELGIDPDRIAVGGGSAGGHVALGTALFDGVDHADDDLNVSCKPNALVLLFAVLDTSPDGYGNKVIGEKWEGISPRHQIRPGMPPTLVFHGDQDGVAPYPILTDFCKRMRECGNTCELVLEKGGRHGHINSDMKLFDDAAKRTAAFLAKNMTGSSRADRPNVLFLFTDDQRFDTISALGNPTIHTPNMDRLVRSGVTFKNAYIMGGSSPAVCSPSRASLFSGRTLWNLENQGMWGFEISDKYKTLPQVFRESGYVTFGTGKNEPGRAGHFARSFSAGDKILFRGMTSSQYKLPLCPFSPIGDYSKKNEVMHIGIHSAEVYADAAIKFLEEQADSKQPFFIYVAFQTPHDPRQCPESYRDQYKDADMPLPESFMPEHPFDNGMLKIRDEKLAGFPRKPDEVRKHIADYYATIAHTDAQIGRILEALEKTGRMDNTLIVFSSDNGLAVGRHGLMGKQNVYDHSVHVPLVIAGPGIAKGQVRDQMCYIYDIYPTLCERAGLATPDTVEFKSLNSVIDNDSKHRDHLYFAFMSWQRAVRDARYKLIEYCVNSERHTQLFDLENDPQELKNLADNPAFTGQLKSLRALLKSDAVRLNDGNVPYEFSCKLGKEFWSTYESGDKK